MPIEKIDNIEYNGDTKRSINKDTADRFMERSVSEQGCIMTALRQSAIRELEKIPEDKIGFILQIMQGVNGLYNDNQSERKEAFARLEKLRRKGTVTDYDAELASYREEKYGK